MLSRDGMRLTLFNSSGRINSSSANKFRLRRKPAAHSQLTEVGEHSHRRVDGCNCDSPITTPSLESVHIPASPIPKNYLCCALSHAAWDREVNAFLGGVRRIWQEPHRNRQGPRRRGTMLRLAMQADGIR